MKYQIGQILNFRYYDGIMQKLIVFGNLIRYGEKGATHSALVYDVNDTDVIVAEALGNGFTISPYEKWWVDARIEDGTIRVGKTIEPLTNIQENIKKYEGTPYGWLDLINCAWYILFGKAAFSFSNGAKSLICSEAVARCLYDSSKTINFEKEFNKPYDCITPQDLAQSKQITWNK